MEMYIIHLMLLIGSLLSQIGTQVISIFNNATGMKYFAPENLNTSYLSDILVWNSSTLIYVNSRIVSGTI